MGEVVKLVDSAGHSAPLAKINSSQGIFFVPAFNGMFEGMKINFDSKEVSNGNLLQLKEIPVKTQIYFIESRPGDGGIFIRTAAGYGTVTRNDGKDVYVLMPSKKEKKFDGNCRALIGIIAGFGRTEKPFLKAGNMHHLKKAKNKLWPRTSAIKMNVIDHPFGSGRGKNPKSKVAKRNAPAGKRVGLIRPDRTGRRKR